MSPVFLICGNWSLHLSAEAAVAIIDAPTIMPVDNTLNFIGSSVDFRVVERVLG